MAKKEKELVQKLDDFMQYCDRQHNISKNGWETVLRIQTTDSLKTTKGQSYHKQYAERMALLKLFNVATYGKIKGMR